MLGKCVINQRVMEHNEMMEWAQGRLSPYLEAAETENGAALAPLSPREMEILEMVTRGASNKEIAFRLNISQQTVKNHMTAILRKLRVDDRTQAAVYALRHGWVRLEPTR